MITNHVPDVLSGVGEDCDTLYLAWEQEGLGPGGLPHYNSSNFGYAMLLTNFSPQYAAYQ